MNEFTLMKNLINADLVQKSFNKGRKNTAMREKNMIEQNLNVLEMVVRPSSTVTLVEFLILRQSTIQIHTIVTNVNANINSNENSTITKENIKS